MNKQITKAIKDSIEHHKDNLYKLETLKGEFKNHDNPNICYFRIGNNRIYYDDKHCALCNLFGRCWIVHKMKNCPLIERGNGCNTFSSPWNKIFEADTKKEAIKAEKGMIKVLKKLLKQK